MQERFSYILKFLLLVLVQVLLLDNIHLFGAQAYLYIMFLVIFPISISSKILMPISFLLGLCVDIFSGTYGIHAAATTFVAFARPFLIRLLFPLNDVNQIEVLSLSKQKISFVCFVAVIVFLHHFVLLMLEAFSFNYIGVVVGKTLLSSIYTLILTFCLFLFQRK